MPRQQHQQVKSANIPILVLSLCVLLCMYYIVMHSLLNLQVNKGLLLTL